MFEKIKFFLLPRLIKWLMLAVCKTCGVHWLNADLVRGEEETLLVSAWHNCSTLCVCMMRNGPYTVMVSESRDGDYVSELARIFGIESVRGSTSRGAQRAVRAALKVLRSHRSLAITPDGPRGPRYKAQPGILWFAAISGRAIVPMHIEATRQWLFKSWDGHIMPKPFSTIVIGFGDPIYVDRSQLESSPDEVSAGLERDMMRNVEKVQQSCEQLRQKK